MEVSTFNTFYEEIKPLLDEIMKLCEDKGIEYYTVFEMNNSQVARFKSKYFNPKFIK